MEFNLDSLVVFKLMNGEIIICEILAEDEIKVTVRCAIRALEMFMEDACEVQFLQWIPYTQDTIIISRHGILASAPPDEKMKEMYLSRMTQLEALEENFEASDTPVRLTCDSGNFKKNRCT